MRKRQMSAQNANIGKGERGAGGMEEGKQRELRTGNFLAQPTCEIDPRKMMPNLSRNRVFSELWRSVVNANFLFSRKWQRVWPPPLDRKKPALADGTQRTGAAVWKQKKAPHDVRMIGTYDAEG